MLRSWSRAEKAALGLIMILGAVLLTSALRQLQPPAPEAIYFVPGRPFQAALTFEPRWSSEGLTELLQVLEREEVAATFFITGTWLRNHPAEAARILKQGHEIGNHTLNDALLLFLTEEEIGAELDGFNEAAREILEYRPRLFRPPRGLYNGVVLQAARQRRCETVLWSIESYDHLGGDPAELSARIGSRLHHGAIISFRVGAPALPEVLPLLLSHMRAQGFSAVTVSDLLKK